MCVCVFPDDAGTTAKTRTVLHDPSPGGKLWRPWATKHQSCFWFFPRARARGHRMAYTPAAWLGLVAISTGKNTGSPRAG